jgi:hypothetical protein
VLATCAGPVMPLAGLRSRAVGRLSAFQGRHAMGKARGVGMRIWAKARPTGRLGPRLYLGILLAIVLAGCSGLEGANQSLVTTPKASPFSPASAAALTYPVMPSPSTRTAGASPSFDSQCDTPYEETIDAIWVCWGVPQHSGGGQSMTTGLAVAFKNLRADAGAIVTPAYTLFGPGNTSVTTTTGSLFGSEEGLFIPAGGQYWDYLNVPKETQTARVDLHVRWLPAEVVSSFVSPAYDLSCATEAPFRGCSWVNNNRYPVRIRQQVWLLLGDRTVAQVLTEGDEVVLPAVSTTFIPWPKARADDVSNWLASDPANSILPSLRYSLDQPNFPAP